jgi:hypothetical protein
MDSTGNLFNPIGLAAFETQFLNYQATHPKVTRCDSASTFTEKEAAALVTAYYAHGGLHPEDVEGLRQIIRSAIGLYVCKPTAELSALLQQGTTYVGMFSTPVVGVSHILRLAAEFKAEAARMNVAAVKHALSTQMDLSSLMVVGSSPAVQSPTASEAGWHNVSRRCFEHLAGEGSESASAARIEEFVLGMLSGWQALPSAVRRFLARFRTQVHGTATYGEFAEFVVEPLRFLMGEAAGRTAALVDPQDVAHQQDNKDRFSKSSVSRMSTTTGPKLSRKGGPMLHPSDQLYQSISKVSERRSAMQVVHDTVLQSPRTVEAYNKTQCVLQAMHHLKCLNVRRLQRFCDRMVRHTARRFRLPGRVVACVTAAAALCAKHRDCTRCEWLNTNAFIAFAPGQRRGRGKDAAAANSPSQEEDARRRKKKRAPMPTNDDVNCTFTPVVCPHPPKAKSSGGRQGPRVVVNENLLLLNISRAAQRQERLALRPSSSAGPLDFGTRRYDDDIT